MPHLGAAAVVLKFQLPAFAKSLSGVFPPEDQLTLSDRVRRTSAKSYKERKPDILESAKFNVPVTLLILANTIQLGLSVDLTGQDWDPIWSITNYIFTVSFTLEMIFKCYILRLRYFQSRWNWLDFGLVWLVVLEIAMEYMRLGAQFLKNSSMIRTLRLLRLARVLKMVKTFKELRILTDAIIKALRTMTWIVLMVCLLVYVTSIFFTETIGRNVSYPDFNDDPDFLTAAGFNNHQYFGSLWRSMLTCFSLITLSEWSTITRPVAEHQPIMLFCLISFVLMTAFGIMNVIIGIMAQHALDAAMQASESRADCHRKEQMAFLTAVEEIVAHADTDKNGQIEFREFQAAVDEDQELGSLMMRADLPGNFTVKELFTLLDVDGDGVLSSSEFHKEMYRLVYCNDFQRICVLQSSLNQVKQKITEVSRGLFGRRPFVQSFSNMPVDSQEFPLGSASLDVASALSSLQQEMTELRTEVQQNFAQLNCSAMKCAQRKEEITCTAQCHPHQEMQPPTGLPANLTPDFKAGACQHNNQQSALDSILESAFELLQQNVAQTIDECLRSTIQMVSENGGFANTPQKGTSCEYDGIAPCDQQSAVSQERTHSPTLGRQPKAGSNSVVEQRPSSPLRL